jgi:hypothetical protein
LDLLRFSKFVYFINTAEKSIGYAEYSMVENSYFGNYSENQGDKIQKPALKICSIFFSLEFPDKSA